MLLTIDAKFHLKCWWGSLLPLTQRLAIFKQNLTREALCNFMLVVPQNAQINENLEGIFLCEICNLEPGGLTPYSFYLVQ